MMIVFYPRKRLSEGQRTHAMREILVSRDGPCCTYCGVDLLSDPRLFVTMALDHFVPRSRGGRNAVENRVLACYACDRLKAGREFETLDEARAFIAAAYAKANERRQNWRK